MKIRNGHVSNSSSSSFLVAFPTKLDSINAVSNYFGFLTVTEKPDFWDEDQEDGEAFNDFDVIEHIYDNKDFVSKETLFDKAKSNVAWKNRVYFEKNYPKVNPKYNWDTVDIDNPAYIDDLNRMALIEYNRLYKQYENMYVYSWSFSDNADGIEYCLHSDFSIPEEAILIECDGH